VAAHRVLSAGLSTTQTHQGLHATRLVYHKYGKPSEVLKFDFQELTHEVGPDEVLVRMLAAPINPSDINQVEGTYPVKPASLPAVGGNEGVGEVALVGENVTHLEPLDRVIPAISAMGTWTSAFHARAEDLLKVPADLPVELTGTMAVNPCTAYRMLQDFVPLQPGDTVIQNASNSGVGQAAIQIARSMDVESICLVRDRDDFDETAERLMAYGASLVISEPEARTKEGRARMEAFKPPSLGLNCVGGRACITLMRALDHGGTMVTYGGMSRQPVSVPAGLLIFNDARVVGFWMTRWNSLQTRETRETMLEEVGALIRAGSLNLHYKTRTLDEHAEAIEAAQQGFIGKKQIFLFS